MSYHDIMLNTLSYDVETGSEITPCFGKHYDVHNNVAYIMT